MVIEGGGGESLLGEMRGDVAKAFRVDLPGLVKLRYPDPQRYLVELIRRSVARNAQYIRIVPADVNKGRLPAQRRRRRQRSPTGTPDDDGLSAGFLVSDTVTQSQAAASAGWAGSAVLTAPMSSTTRSTGTTVTLRRRRGETLLNAAQVVELARQYAEMLVRAR